VIGYCWLIQRSSSNSFFVVVCHKIQYFDDVVLHPPACWTRGQLSPQFMPVSDTGVNADLSFLHARAAVQHERGPRRFKCRSSAAAYVTMNSLSSSCPSINAASSSSVLPVRPSPQPAATTTGRGLERPMDLRLAVAASLQATCSGSNVVDDATTRCGVLQQDSCTLPLFTATASRTLTPHDVR